MVALLPPYTPLLDLLPGSSADIHRAAQDTRTCSGISSFLVSPRPNKVDRRWGLEMVEVDGTVLLQLREREEKTRAALKAEYEHTHGNATWGACMPSLCPRPMTCTPHPITRLTQGTTEEPMSYTGGSGRRR